MTDTPYKNTVGNQSVAVPYSKDDGSSIYMEALREARAEVDRWRAEADALFHGLTRIVRNGPPMSAPSLYRELHRFLDAREQARVAVLEAEPSNADSAFAPEWQEARVTAALRDAERADRALKEAESEIARLRNVIIALLEDGP